MDNWENFYGTGSLYTTQSTSEIPRRQVPNIIWYGIDQPFEHTAKTIVRLLRFCDNCGDLQIKGRDSCPACGVLYKKVR